MNAYDKSYLEDAMHNLAVMLDYGTVKEGDAERFFDRFKVSDISMQFGKGNPRYLVGMSGIELAEEVFRNTGQESGILDYHPDGRSVEYWAGWVLAYLQWYTGMSFEQIDGKGLHLSYVISLYSAYHEADISKFVQKAIERIKHFEVKGMTPLKRQRKICRLTQKELSQRSGITLRMIQAYEQNDQDISRAEVRTIIKLANVLGCSPEDLIAGAYTSFGSLNPESCVYRFKLSPEE